MFLLHQGRLGKQFLALVWRLLLRQDRIGHGRDGLVRRLQVVLDDLMILLQECVNSFNDNGRFLLRLFHLATHPRHFLFKQVPQLLRIYEEAVLVLGEVELEKALIGRLIV